MTLGISQSISEDRRQAKLQLIVLATKPLRRRYFLSDEVDAAAGAAAAVVDAAAGAVSLLGFESVPVFVSLLEPVSPEDLGLALP